MHRLLYGIRRAGWRMVLSIYRRLNRFTGNRLGATKVLSLMRRKTEVMRGNDVLRVIDALAAADVQAWIIGGWGVDALVGARTRRHRDLDLIVRDEYAIVERALRALGEAGFSVREKRLNPTSYLPMCFVLDDRLGHGVDLLPVDLDRPPFSTPLSPAAEDKGERREFGEFTTGLVEGQPVNCASAQLQELLHRGYDLRSIDERDLRSLSRCVDLRPR
jgi:lincosamide nucleotidyltransferase A/C/D/E